MKKVILALILCVILGQPVKAVDSESSVYEQDWQSPQAIVTALYAVVSAGPKEVRDWTRFRNLFFQGAQFTMAFESEQGGKIITSNVEQLIEQTELHYKDIGFYEIETDQHMIEYNHMANVYSSFEIKNTLTDVKPLMRGLNHFQLLCDGKRWWIISNTSILVDETFTLPVDHLFNL